MPLRDHFHPPLSKRRSWDELHGVWPTKMVESLLPSLPAEYIAAPYIHLGSAVEVDVATYKHDPNGTASWNADTGHGGAATAVWQATEPTLRVEADFPDVDEYEVRVYDVTHERKLVAAVELVSPANKDRQETRAAFVAKCASLLQQNVSVAIVDVVTDHGSNLYSELLAFLGKADETAKSEPPNIYAVACRAKRPGKRWQLEAWNRPLKVGEALPNLPIWLADDLAITLELESSYEAACRVLRMV